MFSKLAIRTLVLVFGLTQAAIANDEKEASANEPHIAAVSDELAAQYRSYFLMRSKEQNRCAPGWTAVIFKYGMSVGLTLLGTTNGIAPATAFVASGAVALTAAAAHAMYTNATRILIGHERIENVVRVLKAIKKPEAKNALVQRVLREYQASKSTYFRSNGSHKLLKGLSAQSANEFSKIKAIIEYLDQKSLIPEFATLYTNNGKTFFRIIVNAVEALPLEVTQVAFYDDVIERVLKSRNAPEILKAMQEIGSWFKITETTKEKLYRKISLIIHPDKIKDNASNIETAIEGKDIPGCTREERCKNLLSLVQNLKNTSDVN